MPGPDLPSGQIEVLDCSSNVLSATGGKLIVNGNRDDCPCVDPSRGIETTSFATVFALHQNVPNPFNPTTVIGSK